MADNVLITSAGGTTVGTDDCGGVQIQKVKLVDGTADSTAVIPGDATNGLDVDVTRLPTDTAAAATTVAHDAADSGHPIKIGGKARVTDPAAVTALDRADLYVDNRGKPVVRPWTVREEVAPQQTTITNSTSETTIVTAGGADFLRDLLALIISNAGATGVAVTIKDATAGTTRAIIYVPATDTVVVPFPVPVPQAADNENWTATLSINTVTVHITALFMDVKEA